MPSNTQVLTPYRGMELASLGDLLARHSLYPGFVDYMRRTATKVLTDRTVIDRLAKLEVLRNSYHIQPDDIDVTTALRAVENRGCSAATLNAFRFVLKHWTLYLRGQLTQTEQKELKYKSGSRRRKISGKDYLTADERTAIIGHIHSPTIRAYLAVLWDTGARPAEVATLQIRDVHEDQYGFIFQLHQTKYQVKKRPVRMLDPLSIAIFTDWWLIHPARQKPEATLFPNRHGRPLDVHGTSKFIRRFNLLLNRGSHGDRCSLNLYLYRKSRAYHLLKEKILNESEIKLRMGHLQHSRVLEQYYAILEEEDLAQAELRYLGAEGKQWEPMRPEPCPHCGTPNSPDMMFCVKCRQPLKEQAVQAQHQQILSEAIDALLEDPQRLQRLADELASLSPRTRARDLSSQESDEPSD